MQGMKEESFSSLFSFKRNQPLTFNVRSGITTRYTIHANQERKVKEDAFWKHKHQPQNCLFAQLADFFLNRTSRALCSIFPENSGPDQSWSSSSSESTCWATNATLCPKPHCLLSIETTQEISASQFGFKRRQQKRTLLHLLLSLSISSKRQAISMKRKGRRHLICLSRGIIHFPWCLRKDVNANSSDPLETWWWWRWRS